MDFSPDMIDPYFDPLQGLSPEKRRAFLQKQQGALQALIEAAPGLASKIHVNARGFITPIDQDTLPVEVLRRPAPIIVFAPAPEISEEEIGEPNPVADLILETLQQASAMRHIYWIEVQKTLSTIPPEKRTTKKLVSLLFTGLFREKSTWNHFQEIEQYISLESLKPSSRRRGLEYWILRILGILGRIKLSQPLFAMVNPKISKDLLALEDVLIQLQNLDTVDADHQVPQTRVQKLKEIVDRLMPQLRPGKLFAAMTGHLSQLVQDLAPDDVPDYVNKLLIDCALYL